MWRGILLVFIISALLQFSAASQRLCKDSLPLSILPNAGFEDYNKCNPNWRGEGGIIDGNSSAINIQVPYWHPENTHQFIRYYNYDCRRQFGSIFAEDFNILDTGFPGIPDSLHSKGLISIEQYNFGFDSYLPENKTDKRYIATCLPSPLVAGKSYGFAFRFGFGRFNANYNDVTGFWASPSPFQVGIFGRTDCPSFPIDRPAYLSAGCLADRGDWIQLGTVTLHGKNKWVPGYIEFTAPAGISSIGIGPSCDYNENIKDTFALYYMDNFVLSEKENFAFASITAVSGNPCTGNYILQAPVYENATYQWFKEEKLIEGATSINYKVPDQPGADGIYFVNITLRGDCFVSLPYTIKLSPVHNLALGSDKILCDTTAIQLHATLSGVTNYHWQNGSGDSVISVKTSGTYTVTVADNTGCANTASVNVFFENCNNCKIVFPGAFTPNHDGINDIFRPKALCGHIPLAYYHLIIYNRWGQAVFNSSNPAEGWDGSYLNTGSPENAYVYFSEYSFFNGKRETVKGVVTLIR
jgi:gliding motility-associated-like protein